MNSRKMVAAIALSVICGGLVIAADNKTPIVDNKNPIKEVALAQADAETALVATRLIFNDQALFRGNIEKYRTLFNEGRECIGKARQDEHNKGDSRIDAVIAGCNEDEGAMNLKNRADDQTIRQAEMVWGKAFDKFNTLQDSFNRLGSTAEVWKRTGLDVAPVITMNNNITAATATIKEDAEKCVAQMVALAVEMQTKVNEIKAKYAAPGK